MILVKRIYLITILFSLLLINTLYAENFQLSYYYDATNSLNIKDISSKQFKNIPNQYSFDIKKNIVWYKVEILNNTNIQKKLFLHNNIAYMSKNIEIYEMQNNKIVKQEFYNLLDKKVAKKLTGKAIVYPLSLKNNSKKVIYIKNNSLVHQLIDIDIYNQKQSILNSINSNFYSNIIVSVLVALAIYNLMLYLFSKRKEFIFYFFYLLNCAIGLFYMYGSVFHNLNIYGKSAYIFNITAILVTLFLALFIKYIFDIDNNQNKKVNYGLNFLILLSLVETLYAIFVDLYVAVQFVEYLFFISFIIILYTGYILYKQNHPLIKLFIVAYFIYIVGFSITVMGLIGVIKFSTLTLHASGISLVLEGFIFSYMLSYRLKLLEIKVKQQEKKLLIKTKKEQFGEIIGNIAHQWRQPLNRINLNLAVIDDALNNEPIDKDLISKKMALTEKNIHYMSNTIEDFTNFYNPYKEKNIFSLYDIIHQSLTLLSNRVKNIKITTSLDKDIKVNGISNEYLQVLLIILNNAIDNFDNSRQQHTIDIVLTQTKENIILTIEDNGGGILESNIQKIFEPYFTTKTKLRGTGLGLYIAKMIIEDSIYGKIYATTKNHKTIFTIKLKKENI